MADVNSDIIDRLDFVELTNDMDLPRFDCGKEGLNEFINTDEAINYQDARLSKTQLVYEGDSLVGYFALAPTAFTRDDYEGTESANAEALHEKLPYIPSRLLARVAVDLEYQGNGLGQYLVDYIIASTLELDEIPFRLLVLHAHEDVVPFYKKCGFMESETSKHDSWDNTIMFFDLAELDS
jgi:GNAT superfamily N-acetyltransferase